MMMHTDALIAEHFEGLAEGRSATAFHESGHAVASEWLGLGTAEASIVPRFQTAGHAVASRASVNRQDLDDARTCALEGRPVPAYVRDWVEAQVVVCYAGGYAATRAIVEGIATDVAAPPQPTTEAEYEVAEMRAVILRGALALAADEAGEPHVIEDDRQAGDLLRGVSATFEEAEMWSSLLRVRTRYLIRHPVYWASVRRIADSLMERETLDGDEIRRIVAEVRAR